MVIFNSFTSKSVLQKGKWYKFICEKEDISYIYKINNSRLKNNVCVIDAEYIYKNDILCDNNKTVILSLHKIWIFAEVPEPSFHNKEEKTEDIEEFPDLSKHIGRYLEALVDNPNSGAGVKKGDIGEIIGYDRVNFPNYKIYYCPKALSESKDRYRLMPEYWRPCENNNKPCNKQYFNKKDLADGVWFKGRVLKSKNICFFRKEDILEEYTQYIKSILYYKEGTSFVERIYYINTLLDTVQDVSDEETRRLNNFIANHRSDREELIIRDVPKTLIPKEVKQEVNNITSPTKSVTQQEQSKYSLIDSIIVPIKKEIKKENSISLLPFLNSKLINI